MNRQQSPRTQQTGRKPLAQPTAERILDAAVVAYGLRGYAGTSLDDLAREIGVRKQTILYWFPSKDALLNATIDHTAEQLSRAMVAELVKRVDRHDAWSTIEGVVHSAFRIAARRPALLGLVREVSRMGPPAATRLTDALQPIIDGAAHYLEREMDAGHLRRHDPWLLLLSAYSMVVGVATEVEVLRAFGESPTLRSLLRRRDELVSLLRDALVVSG